MRALRFVLCDLPSLIVTLWLRAYVVVLALISLVLWSGIIVTLLHAAVQCTAGP